MLHRVVCKLLVSASPAAHQQSHTSVLITSMMYLQSLVWSAEGISLVHPELTRPLEPAQFVAQASGQLDTVGQR